MSETDGYMVGEGGSLGPQVANWKKARGPAHEIPFGEVTILPGESLGERISQSLTEGMVVPGERSHDGGLLIPVGLLTKCADDGIAAGLPFKLSDATRANLNLDVRHSLMTMTRIHTEDGGSFVRTRSMIWLKDDPEQENPWEEFIDVPNALIGQMLEVLRIQRSESSLLEPPRFGMPRLGGHAPRWAGSYSFSPVLEQARGMAMVDPLRIGSMENPARQITAIWEAGMLAQAHVIRVDPDQVAVLPEWDSDQDVIEYGVEAQLPYETVYLDFEGQGGLRPRVHGKDVTGRHVALTGALMHRNLKENYLTVVVYGWPEGESFSRGEFPWSRYESAGWFVFHPDPILDGIIDQRLPIDPRGTGASATIVATDLCANTVLGEDEVDDDPDGVVGPDDMKLGGHALLPYERRDLATQFRSADEAVGEVIWLSHMIWLLAKKALAALTIVEAEEVVLADAPLERRDRKRAEKRGWPIAQQVFIRPSRRYSERNPPSGAEAHYSHRFWVRGHFAHHPIGSRLALKRPDLVKPCPRTDLATNCGFCRRVWVPPYIKGPEDRPLVLKTLVQRKRVVK